MFKIEILDEDSGENDVLLGRIIAGTLDERFEVIVGDWSQADYETSWRSELSRILAGAKYAVLMTVAADPTKTDWLRGYTLYRFDDEVRVQEKIFLLEELEHPFDLAHPGLHGSPYESMSEDGVPISEWVVTVKEIQEFFDTH